MFEYKKIPKEELKLIIRNASQKMKVNEAIIEKDYWVCFILNYLFSNCRWRESLAFKGGTSLSKCFGLIRRFSEDIDLILDWRVIGYEKDEPWQERSGTKQDKFNQEANRRTEIFLQNELIPQMIEDLRNALDEDFMVSIDKKDHQTVLFEYPKVFAPQYLTQAVRLEIGALAAWTPSEVIGIKPDIYSAYPMLFNGDHIEVRTVLPERTFWEKATILHHEANRPKELRMPNRYARHYYDLYQMSHSEYKDRAFQNLELFRKVVAPCPKAMLNI